jgi:hypothetical protein
MVFRETLGNTKHTYVVFQNGKMIGSGFSLMLPSYLFTAEKTN